MLAGQPVHLRGDVVLGRYEVAGITDSDGRIAIAVGGQGSLGYNKFENQE